MYCCNLFLSRSLNTSLFYPPALTIMMPVSVLSRAPSPLFHIGSPAYSDNSDQSFDFDSLSDGMLPSTMESDLRVLAWNDDLSSPRSSYSSLVHPERRSSSVHALSMNFMSFTGDTDLFIPSDGGELPLVRTYSFSQDVY
jgi:hypothetical protein